MDIQLIPCKRSDSQTLKYQNYFLHSVYNPEDEAKKFAEKNYQKGNLHILYGIGLGYYALEISELFSEKDHLLIVEPNEEIYQTAEQNGFLEILKEKQNVTICTFSEGDTVRNNLKIFLAKFKNKHKFITSNNYSKLFPNELDQIGEWIKEYLLTEILNLNTVHLFAESWQRNFIHNLYSLFEAYPINNLHKSIKKPIIIASGGPSLLKHLKLLELKRSQFFLIAAGSTINSLIKYNIQPDLIVSIDGGLPNYEHFESLDVTIPLACAFTLHEGIAKEYKGDKIVFHVTQDGVYEQLVHKFMDSEIASFYTGPSVANISLNIATYLTDFPICLIGQDLSYTNNLTHAAGNLHSKTINEEYKSKRKMMEREGYHGGQVLTDAAFMSMKNWFEDFLKISEDSDRIYNCTEGGVKILGMNQMSFAQFLNENAPSTGDENEFADKQFVNEKTLEQWRSFYSHLQETLNNMEKAQYAVKQAKRKLENRTSLTNNILRTLEKQDKKLKNAMEDNFLHLVLNPYLYMLHYEKEDETLEGKENEKEKAMIEKSLKLYNTINKAVDSIFPDVKMIIEKTKKKIDLLEKE
ncbi:motility associated factor glycosyltransferase family protein [Domibacillus iocasae]|uniref:6-hydroxymethylpterin diphosphokinase MptE-like domain-containing protein n=1 Tax=Domibacillus iocasae TaxID=1714016 RepID=A0A1E7DSR5_9BACI|nr:6-hydroxymethylpterin diphosphokinase MptE-like protein [Domibacillus iocasae]OES46055.1 hypothetical protein BA724_15820 [Domibacillus iocasae]